MKKKKTAAAAYGAAAWPWIGIWRRRRGVKIRIRRQAYRQKWLREMAAAKLKHACMAAMQQQNAKRRLVSMAAISVSRNIESCKHQWRRNEEKKPRKRRMRGEAVAKDSHGEEKPRAGERSAIREGAALGNVRFEISAARRGQWRRSAMAGESKQRQRDTGGNQMARRRKMAKTAAGGVA